MYNSVSGEILTNCFDYRHKIFAQSQPINTFRVCNIYHLDAILKAKDISSLGTVNKEKRK